MLFDVLLNPGVIVMPSCRPFNPIRLHVGLVGYTKVLQHTALSLHTQLLVLNANRTDPKHHFSIEPSRGVPWHPMRLKFNLEDKSCGCLMMQRMLQGLRTTPMKVAEIHYEDGCDILASAHLDFHHAS